MKKRSKGVKVNEVSKRDCELMRSREREKKIIRCSRRKFEDDKATWEKGGNFETCRETETEIKTKTAKFRGDTTGKRRGGLTPSFSRSNITRPGSEQRSPKDLGY